jgi:DNA uptake protein ComE-like DNA-binding protein
MKLRRRAGMVLVFVLVMIAVLAVSSLGVLERMLSERRAVQVLGRRMQARAAAESGVEMARQFLDRSADEQNELGGWYDNPQLFSGVLVADDDLPRNRGRFTLLAPLVRDRAAAETRCGLEDESARINLRTILKADKSGGDGAKKILMGLPGMTDAIADAILDWIDADSVPRTQGAEADYYSSLSPAYAPRNGPPATIEELLLVRGVTPQLLFGLDAARIGAAGGPAGAIEGVDNSDGSMDHGWAAYLTLYGAESNLRSDGTAKINLNGSDLKQLYDDLEKELGAEWATFIVAYRQSGSQGNSQPGAAKAAAPAGKLDFTKKASATLTGVLDLVGVRTSAKFEGAKENTVLDSPFTDDRAAMGVYLPKLLDSTTVGAAAPGRININQASRIVLATIPGITPEVVDQIIARRVSDPVLAGANRRHETWIIEEGIVNLATMKLLMPYVTAGGSVYRVQAFGFFEAGPRSPGGPVARLEVFLDASKPPTSVLFWRDVSHLGLGYTPDALVPPTSE